ncbi:MAG: hypothetical protein V2A73_02925, partial [Pseudomonadota bacterium]
MGTVAGAERAAMRVLRVFPQRTTFTPTDALSFVGDPPLLRPEADVVRVSCAFTWDITETMRLVEAWKQHYSLVRYGGPAFGDPGGGFEPGMFVKPGVVHTSRGCPNRCSFCLVPVREGPLRLLPIREGYILSDNNILACPTNHRLAVWQMLGKQRRYAVLSGGLQASLVTDEIADELRGLRLDSVFLAADSEGALKPLATAIKRLSFLPRRKLRCYVLCAYDGETI